MNSETVRGVYYLGSRIALDGRTFGAITSNGIIFMGQPPME